MFLIRQGKSSDLDVLLKLAKMVHFINLPADQDVIENKLRWSRESFHIIRRDEPARDADADPELPSLGGAAGSSPLFMFVAEDMETGNIVGTSGIVAKMGGPGKPNVAMKLRKREFFSRDLQGGATHVTAQLVLDESGPTEIGGLIVGPSFRRHPLRVGKQLSLVRFHYIGLHRKRFQDRVLAEMMAPLTHDGRNTFWEYFGRRFINLTYDEADRFCQKSREFMTSLLPKEEIYLTLLPPEARTLVGHVGADTVPARRMLEKLGFVHRDFIDPFDGGPHLEAKTDEIPLVRDTRRLTVSGDVNPSARSTMAFVSLDGSQTASEEFRCVWTECAVDGDSCQLPEEAMHAIGARPGDVVGWTPLGGGTSAPPDAATGKQQEAKAST